MCRRRIEVGRRGGLIAVAKFVVLQFYGCGFAGAPQLSVEVRQWDADKLEATRRFE